MEENNHGSQYSPTVACMYVNEMNLSLPWKSEALYNVYEYMCISTFVWVFFFFSSGMIRFVKEEENQSLGEEDWRSIEMSGGIFEARKSWKANICGGGWK